MNESDASKAKKSLTEFMDSMKNWEENYYLLFKTENGGPEKNGEKAREDLAKIYDQYLTKKDRKTGRLAGPDVGYPTEFDPMQEVIDSEETISHKKILFTSTWTHPALSNFTEKRRYTLTKSGDKWLIDKKESFSSYKGKWVNCTL